MIFEFRSLDDIDNDKQKWGGKAYGLSIIKKHGFPVPDGIVLSSDAFKAYRENKLHEIEAEPLLKDMLDNHFINQNLIVRSSANVEGNIDSCYCGIFDSYIYDTNMTVYRNIARVWDSALESVVDAYQQKNKYLNEIAMAVLIQPLIIGSYSAVVQSYDIINDLDRVIIEYSSNGFDKVVNGGENSFLAYINPATKDVEYFDLSCPKLSYVIIDRILVDCKKIESIFSTHVELELQLFESSVKYIQIREVA